MTKFAYLRDEQHRPSVTLAYEFDEVNKLLHVGMARLHSNEPLKKSRGRSIASGRLQHQMFGFGPNHKEVQLERSANPSFDNPDPRLSQLDAKVTCTLREFFDEQLPDNPIAFTVSVPSLSAVQRRADLVLNLASDVFYRLGVRL